MTQTLRSGAQLIRTMADLIKEAIATHIYDADNGEAPGPDCAYSAALAEAEAFLAQPSPDKSTAILRALTIDLGDDYHDYVDLISGLDVVKLAAAEHLLDLGLSPVPSDAIASPDDESIAEVYTQALAVAGAVA